MTVTLSQSRQTALVIDDDDNVRNFLHVALNRLGYCVLATPCAMTGLTIFQRYQYEIDLILLAMNMPEMNGVELYKKLRQWDPFAKCLMIKGDVLSNEIKPLKGAGLAGYLSKPFTADALVNHLQGVTVDAASVV